MKTDHQTEIFRAMSKPDFYPHAVTAIEQRDKNDRDRAVGPLKPADDAILIDTTDLNIEQVVDKLLGFVKENA